MFKTGPSHMALYCYFLPGVENSKLPFEEKRLSNRDKKHISVELQLSKS